MPIWQLCANLLIPNCLRSNLSYSPLAALELYVNIGNNVIVAQNSVVIKDISDNTIVSGIPAKPIKTFYNMDEINI